MNSFLISFCNNRKNKSSDKKSGLLGLITLKNNHLTYTDICLECEEFDEINGITGLAQCNDYYYLAAQSKHSKLLVLNKQFELIHCISLEPIKGAHSVLYDNGSLYLVATKQDRVVKYNFSRGIRAGVDHGFETVFEIGTLADTHHINSICMHQGDIIISAFGSKEKEFWMYAEEGYALNINSNTKLISGLKQPHSLFSYNNELYVCDSSRKRVIKENGEVITQVEHGYTRGLYINDSVLLFGTSKGRVVSHSQNKYVGNISDQGILAGESGVTLIQNDQTSHISLQGIAEEVYDIMPV